LENNTPAMKVIGSIVRTSVIRNFEKGGRPKRWKKHSKTTQKRRGKGAPILRDQGFAGGLMGSIHTEAHRDRAIVGTDKIYGAVHQFGAKKGEFGTVAVKIGEQVRQIKGGKLVYVKPHTRNMVVPWGDIPARPYMVVQNEDMREMEDALKDFIIYGGTA